jgi:triacylglycerol lipase
MNFSVFPPEVNSLLLLDGPGSGPLWEAATAWDAISSELSSTADAFGSVTSGLAAQAWQGPASGAMTTAASGYVGWLGDAAAQAGQSAAQARAAAAAYEAAIAAIVDPALVSANRGELVSLVLSNLFGQNAPAIAAAESEYEQMWAHDVAVMGGYHTSASATVSQLGQWEQALQGGVATVEQGVQQIGTAVTGIYTRVADSILNGIFGLRATPFSATQVGTYSGTPSIFTRIEEAVLYPVKPFLAFTGLESQVASPNSPLLSLFTGNNPLLGLFIGNQPPQLLPALLGESVRINNFNGMPVVQITPAHPTGNIVVAIHGGAFIFPPSIFHWLDYTIMAYQTGATIEVPIYPLLQQGGTAGTVVPQMAGLISSEIAASGAPHVSVIGDSAGGNLALAATEFLVANNDPVESSMVLLSPWLNLAMTNPNIGLVQDPLLPLGPAATLGKIWAGGLPVSNYMVSPLNGITSGLPQTTVYSGNLDILSPDALVLQQEAATVGANFNFVLGNGEIHDWIILTPDGPQYWPQIDQELGI